MNDYEAHALEEMAQQKINPQNLNYIYNMMAKNDWNIKKLLNEYSKKKRHPLYYISIPYRKYVTTRTSN